MWQTWKWLLAVGICLPASSSAWGQVEDIDPLYDEQGEPLDEREDFQEDDGVAEPDLGDYSLDGEGGIGDSDTNDLGFEAPLDDEAADGEIDDPLADDAEDKYADPTLFETEDLPDFHRRSSEFSLTRRDPDEPRSYWWPALVSIPLPGFGQWYDGQYGWAMGYSGAATLGLGYAFSNVPDAQGESESDAGYQNRNTFGVTERKFLLGLQVFQVSGGLSAYHSFRTAVRTRQPRGEFGFLQEEESIAEIMTAPFDMSHLLKPTTYIPLAVGGVLYAVITEHYNSIDEDLTRRDLEGSDVFFASAISYNAGTHEEAVFRGWVQPMFYHITSGQSIWSNVITSGIFAAAHLPTNPAPLPQLALSLHLGWVTERNRWTIAESVFIHTWWDVIAFMAQYQVMLKEGSDSKIQPALHLPPLEFRF